jgi:hypothetical protein
MHVTGHFSVTSTHIEFRVFPEMMLGMCWEQTKQELRPATGFILAEAKVQAYPAVAGPVLWVAPKSWASNKVFDAGNAWSPRWTCVSGSNRRPDPLASSRF